MAEPNPAPRRFVPIAAAGVFLVTFNLGYVFHDLLLGTWFHEQEAGIARDEFIVPLVGLAFAVYSVILAHLFVAYRQRYTGGSVLGVGLRFGVLMGVVFDALQGGIIEYATMRLPFVVFAVDSTYHVFVEGSIAGLILGALWSRLEARAGRSVAAEPSSMGGGAVQP